MLNMEAKAGLASPARKSKTPQAWHSWALVKAGTALDQARGGLETPFSSVIFSYLILARPALRRSRPSVACLTTSGLAHTADAQALRRWPPPSGLAHTAGAHPYIFSYFYSTRGRALARRPSGLASRPTLVHSKAATLSASPTARRGAALAPASGILMTSALRTRCTDAAVAGWLGAAGCVV